MLGAALASGEAYAHTTMAKRGGRRCAALCQRVGLVADGQPSSPYIFSLVRLDFFIVRIPWRRTLWRNRGHFIRARGISGFDRSPC
jgi:hypothetical protein